MPLTPLRMQPTMLLPRLQMPLMPLRSRRMQLLLQRWIPPQMQPRKHWKPLASHRTQPMPMLQPKQLP